MVQRKQISSELVYLNMFIIFLGIIGSSDILKYTFQKLYRKPATKQPEIVKLFELTNSTTYVWTLSLGDLIDPVTKSTLIVIKLTLNRLFRSKF